MQLPEVDVAAYVPTAQLVHILSPAAAYFPAAQAVHALKMTIVPAGQLFVHMKLPEVDVNDDIQAVQLVASFEE